MNTNVGYAWLDDRNAKCPYDGNQVINNMHLPCKNKTNLPTGPGVETNGQRQAHTWDEDH